MGLEVADGDAECVGREEATETGGIISGEGIVQARFGVTLVAGEFVVRWARSSL